MSYSVKYVWQCWLVWLFLLVSACFGVLLFFHQFLAIPFMAITILFGGYLPSEIGINQNMLCWLLILLMECDSILVCLLYKWVGPFPLHFYIDYCFSIFDIFTTAYLWEFFPAMSIWCSLYLYINYFFSITLVLRGFADLPVFLMFFSPFPSKSRFYCFLYLFIPFPGYYRSK